LQEIASGTEDAFRILFNLSRKPIVTTIFDAADRQGDPSMPKVGRGSRRVLCSLDGYPEQVAASPIVVPHGTLGERGDWSFADRDLISIRWQMYKSPLCYALQAAIAIAIAQRMNSMIEDGAGFFSISNESTSTEFADALRLPWAQMDIRSAAEEFLKRRPGLLSSPDPARPLQ
jgi:hypothetical protein